MDADRPGPPAPAVGGCAAAGGGLAACVGLGAVVARHRWQLAPGPSLDLGEANIRNFAAEGLGWDAQRQQLLVVLEKWPLQVLVVKAPGMPGMADADTKAPAPHVQTASPHSASVPGADLASIEVDPRTGNWLLLSEEASAIYEYTPGGERLDVMPLWADMRGLAQRIPQPEGLALDGDGVLYVVSEPNLFYRFEKKQ
ncbi:hypothetical protein FQA39_LY19127 [Lamprigera yunnana]|nr:hypothetical protein FQA39_LY19127 [Lamprigera yunnana]